MFVNNLDCCIINVNWWFRDDLKIFNGKKWRNMFLNIFYFKIKIDWIFILIVCFDYVCIYIW